jgi:hypothetical protein
MAKARIAFGKVWKILYKECSFCPDPLTNMAATGNSCFWLVYLKKSSPLKPCGQMNRNLVGSIYGRSSIKIANFILICKQTWPPQAILVSDWLISEKSVLLLKGRFKYRYILYLFKMQLSLNWITDKYASKTRQPNELKLGRNHLWQVLHKDCLFRPCGGHVCLQIKMKLAIFIEDLP